MYTLLRSVPHPVALLRQVPTLVVSLAVAERFYRFGSFTLECLACLATWFVLDVAWDRASKLFGRSRPR